MLTELKKEQCDLDIVSKVESHARWGCKGRKVHVFLTKVSRRVWIL